MSTCGNNKQIKENIAKLNNDTKSHPTRMKYNVSLTSHYDL